MTTTPAPAPQKTEKGTSYIVLEQIADATGTYALIGSPFGATSAAAAIRKVGTDAGPGTYVAIPTRSFVPTKVTIETTKVVKLGGA